MSASDEVTETFLEMHFAHALAELFAATFGLRFLRLIKPSSNREAYLGFDQAWVRHNTTPKSFETSLRSAIAGTKTEVERMYVGYFMQFKRVHRLKRTSRHTPAGWHGQHFRSEVDNARRGAPMSQHETLIRLNQIRGADVSYACGMIFDSDAIYDVPNLDELRIVPVDDVVAKGSQGWRQGERHFIYFADETARPEWHSDPFDGTAWHPRDWLKTRRDELSPRNAKAFLTWLEEIQRSLRKTPTQLPFLTILEFDRRVPQSFKPRHRP